MNIALGCQGSGTDNQDGYRVTKGQAVYRECRDAGQRDDSRPRRDVLDSVTFIMLLRRACNLELINCLLLEFSI